MIASTAILEALAGQARRRGTRPAADLYEPILVDIFAGGGGASEGIAEALGRTVDEAVNHDRHAVAMHEINHPHTHHHWGDVFSHEALPAAVAGDRRVGLLWASPDCTQFSRAKGGKPIKRNLRCLCWAVTMWAAMPEAQRPGVIVMENVREFQDYGPCAANGEWRMASGADLQDRKLWEANRIAWRMHEGRLAPMVRPEEAPDPARKGELFRAFVRSLETLGYVVDWRVLDAADYGAPTHRKRWFMVARRDGEAITWPEKTHGQLRFSEATGPRVGRQKAGVQHDGQETSEARKDGPIQAREIADSSRGRGGRARRSNEGTRSDGQRILDLHQPSFPLKPFRTAAECIDWSIACPSIFDRKRPLAEKTLRRIAMGTWRYVITAARPFLVPINHGDGKSHPGERIRSVDRPMNTLTRSRCEYLTAPVLAKYHSEKGSESRCLSPDGPIHTVDTQNRYGLLGASLVGVVCPTFVQVQHGGSESGVRAGDRPLNTITAQPKGGGMALLAASLVGVGGRAGDSPPCRVDEPVRTVTAKGDRAIAAASLVKMRGTGTANAVDAPVGTITGQGMHHALMCATLVKWYGADEHGQGIEVPLHTVTAKQRFALLIARAESIDVADAAMLGRAIEVGKLLAKFRDPRRPEDLDKLVPVIVEGVTVGHVAMVWIEEGGRDAHPTGFYIVVDLGLRMLAPRELARCQGFGEGYVLTGTISQQVARIGNSVCPPVAAAIVRANCGHLVRGRVRQRGRGAVKQGKAVTA